MKGERPNQNQTPATHVQAEERKWKALELRKLGKSYRTIAAEIGCSASIAYKHVSDALRELHGQVLEKAEEVRQLELHKLDALEEELRKRLDGADDQDAAKLSSVILKTQESRRKLLGLDAPQQVEVKGNMYTVRKASPDCSAWDKPHGRSDV